MIPEFTDGFFKISEDYGFLPIRDPLPQLPGRYDFLQERIHQLPNLVSMGGEAISKSIQDMPDCLSSLKNESDPFVLGALFRAYAFIVSAYLLEPAYHTFRETGQYGLGRSRLPIHLSQPLLYLANRLQIFPFLEYNYAYALGNYVRLDAKGSLDVENLSMACSFTGSSDEIGFIMDHVDINQHSPLLIRYANQLLTKPEENALEGLLQTLQDMNRSRQKMWSVSRWERYNDFRVFIMGIQGNTRIFPEGVLYEPETTPRYYRGQSGSQDTIIPFLDTLLRICDFYPKNELTRYLIDMRQYRPKPFRDLLAWLEPQSRDILDKITDTPQKCCLLYQVYSEIYQFRNGHWQFVQKYIMSNTKYPIATGGTPITSWLPNQIGATLQAIKNVMDKIPLCCPLYRTFHEEHERRLQLLASQMNQLSKKDFDISQVYSLNAHYEQQENT